MSLQVLLLGCGNVGTALIELMQARDDRLQQTWQLDLEICGVVRRKSDAPPGLPDVPVFSDIDEALKKTNPNVVVELIGGVDQARTMIEQALEAGADVVTANKAVLAAHGEALYGVAQDHGRLLLGEASVGGAIPILRTLHTSLASDEITRIIGVWNGTCNYILTRMEREGGAFADVLADAQRLGYAEADPDLDINGGDTAHKAVVLAQLAFGVFDAIPEDEYRGISEITGEDLAVVADLGFRAKLVGLLSREPSGAILRYVGPALLPEAHAVASLESVNNGIFVEASDTGAVFLSGPGAGPNPTATAVLGDLIEIARVRKIAATQAAYPRWGKVLAERAEGLSYREGVFPCYVRVHVRDEAGVLAKLTERLAEHGISIRSVDQPLSQNGERVPLYLTTHACRLAQIEAAIASWEQLDAVTDSPFWAPILASDRQTGSIVAST